MKCLFRIKFLIQKFLTGLNQQFENAKNANLFSIWNK